MRLYNKHNFAIHTLAPDENRYYLSGIHVTQKHTEVTNGHFVFRLTALESDAADLPAQGPNLVPLESGVDASISAKSAKKVMGAIPSKPGASGVMPFKTWTWLGKNTTGERVEFLSTDLETWLPVNARRIDGKYPNIEAVLKSTKDKPLKTKISFDAEYMAKLCAMLTKTGFKNVKMETRGPADAIHITGKNDCGQEATVLLMPMQEASE